MLGALTGILGKIGGGKGLLEAVGKARKKASWGEMLGAGMRGFAKGRYGIDIPAPEKRIKETPELEEPTPKKEVELEEPTPRVKPALLERIRMRRKLPIPEEFGLIRKRFGQ